jgi:hypothetical protein
MAMGAKMVMVTAMVTKVVGDKEGNGNGAKSIGNGNEGGWRATAMRAMVTRVAGEQR